MARGFKDSKAGKGGAGAFNSSALSQITSQIDKNLEISNAKNLNGGKRKRNAGAADEEDAAAKPSKKQAPSKSAEQGKSSTREVLLEEIKALGGNEDDLDLVAGVDSDVEEGGSGKKAAATEFAVDDIFAGELAKFAAGLGFDKVPVDEVEAEEEPEDVEEQESEEAEEEDDDEGDDDEDEDMDEAQPSPEPKNEAPKPSAEIPLLPMNPKFLKLIFEPRPDWYAADLSSLPSPTSDEIGRLSHTMAALNTYAGTLMETDGVQYRDIISSSSSHKFMSTIMTSGTMSDRVSALTLEVQEAPVHNIKAFENLMNLAGKRSRGPAISALGALADLLGNGVVLPGDRHLRKFHAQPALLGALQAAGQGAIVWRPGQPLPGKITKAHLVMWKYEDWLKDTYFKILQLLEVWINDEIEYSRSRSLDFVFGLLKSKPEQEANLLRLLVNKLGDREKKIASRASHLLLQLLTPHPGMKSVVIETIKQEVLLRPGQSLRAQYYAINTLNQMILSNREAAVADTLVRIYFDLFLTMLKSGALGSVDIPGEGAITNGDADETTDKTPKKRGGKHHKKKPTKAATEGTEHDVSEKLVSALLTGVNRAIPFANTDNGTLEEHINTLFRITHSSNFNTSIQALILMQHVAMSKHIAVDRFYRTLYESLLDPRLQTSSKLSMYLNLLYRSLKNDVDARRVKAFVKRMLQVAMLHQQTSFVCGILFLVADLESSFPDLKSMVNDPQLDDDDEEEAYHDVVEGDDIAAQRQAEAAKATETATETKITYDGRKRAPEFANAQMTRLWDLQPYLHLFHPTVQVFAQNLIERQVSLPKPDMANHTLMHFLDKFVYRNPKAVESKQRGVSIMQPPTSSATGSASIVTSSGGGKSRQVKQVAINSPAFWSQNVDNVAAEDTFFHTYFTHAGKETKTSRAAKRAAAQEEAKSKIATLGSDDEADDVDIEGEGAGSDLEDADEEEIWQALKASRPEVGADNEDVDMDMDDDEDDLSGLESLLDMSDSDDDGEDDDDLAAMGSDGDDDGVEFADFSDEEDEAAESKKKLTPAEAAAEAFASAKQGSKLRKKQLKALPTFASVEDYMEMLGEEEDEDYH